MNEFSTPIDRFLQQRFLGHVFTPRLIGGISGAYDREYGAESVDDILYALVEEDKVTDVRKAVALRQGDTLELFAGEKLYFF